jgi:glycosyltransferase involved in cell wall biosynthesis
LIVEIAKRLPTIPFVFVVKKKYFKNIKELSPNVKIFYDTTLEEFNDKLSKSNLVVLPINVDTPAGILVLITAGLKSKMVITSDTPSIRNYISNNVNGILLENINIDDWVSRINENFNNKHQQKRLGEKLQTEMLNKTSNQYYMNQLESILKSILKIKNFKKNEDTAN